MLQRGQLLKKERKGEKEGGDKREGCASSTAARPGHAHAGAQPWRMRCPILSRTVVKACRERERMDQHEQEEEKEEGQVGAPA